MAKGPVRMSHVAAPAIGSAVICLVLSCSAGVPVAEDQGQRIRDKVPAELDGWRSDPAWETYDTESIFQYIDGHAEVYLAYGMKRCLSRRYSGPEGEPDIVLDFFELGSPADAFGVFTQDQDGEELDIGRGALFRSGWLSFWKGPWFGSVYAEGDSAASRAAVLALGAAAAAAIDAEGEPPALVARLPAAGLEPRSVRFLRTQEILNSVHYLGFDNPFELGPEVEAVVGRYRVAGGEGWILIVRYPDQETAAAAETKAAAAGIAVRREGSMLAAALAPEPAAIADTLLDAAMGGDR